MASNSSSLPLLSFPISNISNHISIKLDSDNYLLWRDQFLPLLLCNDLLGYVDGSVSPPAKMVLNPTTQTESPNPAYKLWLKTDQFLLSCIKASLSPSTSAHVLGLQTSKQVWDTLETLFQQQSQARLDHLRDRLQNIKKGTSSAEEYLAEIKGVTDKLAAINHSVSDSELVTHTLNGLQHEPNYLPFVYAIENRERPPSLDDLRAHLLVHEQRVYGLLSNQSSIVAPAGSQTSEIALVSRSTNSPHRFDQHRDTSSGSQYHRGGRYRGGRGNCNGGQNGGGRGNGRNYSRDAWGFDRGFRNYRITTCQICQTQGHASDRCNFRYSHNSLPTTQNNYTDHGSLASNFAGMHMGPPAPSDLFTEHASTHWLADSMATNHMTNTSTMLQQPTPYSGSDQVYVGNGNSLPIQSTSDGSTYLEDNHGRAG
ncbi:hypothetical protein F0562_017187 [Nyssa sinensis]|uniref:Uncharacterized protein n=1 Tax=Nyssa sinensis TaxID=561372 RepID=A0A5J4ZEP9_9ASTE|nr:hypothetical protein F0562_017187 [Nyssa sinensis]